MAHWNDRLKLTDLWADFVDDGGEVPTDILEGVVARLKDQRLQLVYAEGMGRPMDLEKYDEIVEEFDINSTRVGRVPVKMSEEEFNDTLNTLYDWGDRVRIWID